METEIIQQAETIQNLRSQLIIDAVLMRRTIHKLTQEKPTANDLKEIAKQLKIHVDSMESVLLFQIRQTRQTRQEVD